MEGFLILEYGRTSTGTGCIAIPLSMYWPWAVEWVSGPRLHTNWPVRAHELACTVRVASRHGWAAQQPAGPSADSTRESDRYGSEILLARLLSSLQLRPQLKAGPVSTHRSTL